MPRAACACHARALAVRWGSAGLRMSRVYREPAEVQAREDGRPARFVWRGRLYTVRSILEHWAVNREWWRETDPAPGGASPWEIAAQPELAQPEPAQPEPAQPGRTRSAWRG